MIPLVLFSFSWRENEICASRSGLCRCILLTSDTGHQCRLQDKSRQMQCTVLWSLHRLLATTGMQGRIKAHCQRNAKAGVTCDRGGDLSIPTEGSDATVLIFLGLGGWYFMVFFFREDFPLFRTSDRLRFCLKEVI